MSTEAANLAQTNAPSSYETFRESQQPIGLSDDAKRLHWVLENPLSTAIHVMEEKYYDPDKPLSPYVDETLPSPSLSPIAQSPLTEPKITSVTVRVEQLDEWEETWLDFHRYHAEPGPEFEGNEDVRFGEFSDYSSDSDEEGPDHLLRCCGGDRPRKMKTSLLVKATGEFITIHDFVSVVHPWLMSMRPKILQASGDLLDNVPLPENTKLMIYYPGPKNIVIYDEHEWHKERLRRG